jgi:hypothetical protein
MLDTGLVLQHLKKVHFQSLLQKEGWQYGPMPGVPKGLTLLLAAYALEFDLPDATAFICVCHGNADSAAKGYSHAKMRFCHRSVFGCTLATRVPPGFN